MESETLIVSGQESFIALSDSNWTTLKNTEAYLACLKTGIIDVNIKRALNIVMERDSKNPTPTIDTEPKKRTSHYHDLYVNSLKACPSNLYYKLYYFYNIISNCIYSSLSSI